VLGDSKSPNAITLSGLQHPLGETGELPIRTDQLDALRPRLGHQLLGHTLLVDARLRRHLLYWFCCHVVDRVSHGLTPFGFQTSQFHRSADSPSLTAAMWAVRYSQGDDWMVFRVKLMSRGARSASLSAPTPVGCSPWVAQIKLS
jgi:hypothetical protein